MHARLGLALDPRPGQFEQRLIQVQLGAQFAQDVGIGLAVGDQFRAFHQHQVGAGGEANAGLLDQFVGGLHLHLGADLAVDLKPAVDGHGDHPRAFLVVQGHAVVGNFQRVEAQPLGFGEERLHALPALGGENILGELAAQERRHVV